MNSAKQNFSRLFHPSAHNEQDSNRFSIYITIAIICWVSILALFITNVIKQKVGERINAEQSLYLSAPININSTRSAIVQTAPAINTIP